MSAITNPALIPPGTGASQALTQTETASGQRVSEASGTTPSRSFSEVLADVAKPSRQAEAAPSEVEGGEEEGGAGQSGESRAESGSLRFSKHALQRVQKRGIELDASTVGRLQDAVGRAAGKGSRDSVVLLDGTAFVVSVANRTVLTAVSPEQMRDQVFTNIDSAVIA